MVDAFISDFSTTQKETNNYDRWTLSDFPPMWSHLDTGFALGFSESIFQTGGRSLVITWGDTMIVQGENPRPTIMVYNMPKEFWAVERFYLPPDFKVKQWLLFCDLFFGEWIPSTDPRIQNYVRYGAPLYFEGDHADGTGNIRLVAQISRWVYTADGSSYVREIPLKNVFSDLIKRGEFFEIYYHVKVAEAGIVEAWFKSPSIPLTKILDYRGETRSISPTTDDTDTRTTVIDHYKRVDEPVSKLYLDYVRWDVYNFFEEAPPTPPIPKSILAVGLPLIAGFILMQLGRG